MQTSRSTRSCGGPWSNSYDRTVTYPGFSAGAYYGRDYAVGREEYFAYLGDAFSDYDGYESGFFPFAYSREQPLFSQLANTLEQLLAVQSVALFPQLHRAGKCAFLAARSRQIARPGSARILENSWGGLTS
ncbi:MAG: hypothetical protein ACUVQK_15100 [Thermogutta sp.]